MANFLLKVCFPVTNQALVPLQFEFRLTLLEHLIYSFNSFIVEDLFSLLFNVLPGIRYIYAEF